jgi:hypothetical protein
MSAALAKRWNASVDHTLAVLCIYATTAQAKDALAASKRSDLARNAQRLRFGCGRGDHGR